MKRGPVIPDKIVHSFKSAFSKTSEYKAISKPEICDELVGTSKFRNPWLDDENISKRTHEAKQKLEDKLKSIDNRKKDMEDKVRVFRQEFFKIHERDPLNSEIIEQLNEEIDIDTLRDIIEIRSETSEV